MNENQSISYVGEVVNNGLRRADFVRVIYNFWAAKIVDELPHLRITPSIYNRDLIERGTTPFS